MQSRCACRGRIAGLHKAMFGEVMEEFTQDIDWLATDSCSLLGTKKQVMAICRRAEAIAEQFQDTLPLFEDRAFIEHPHLVHSHLAKITLIHEVDSPHTSTTAQSE